MCLMRNVWAIFVCNLSDRVGLSGFPSVLGVRLGQEQKIIICLRGQLSIYGSTSRPVVRSPKHRPMVSAEDEEIQGADVTAASFHIWSSSPSRATLIQMVDQWRMRATRRALPRKPGRGPSRRNALSGHQGCCGSIYGPFTAVISCSPFMIGLYHLVGTALASHDSVTEFNGLQRPPLTCRPHAVSDQSGSESENKPSRP